MYKKIITTLVLFLLSNTSFAAHCPGMTDFVKQEHAEGPYLTLNKSAQID